MQNTIINIRQQQRALHTYRHAALQCLWFLDGSQQTHILVCCEIPTVIFKWQMVISNLAKGPLCLFRSQAEYWTSNSKYNLAVLWNDSILFICFMGPLAVIADWNTIIVSDMLNFVSLAYMWHTKCGPREETECGREVTYTVLFINYERMRITCIATVAVKPADRVIPLDFYIVLTIAAYVKLPT